MPSFRLRAALFTSTLLVLAGCRGCEHTLSPEIVGPTDSVANVDFAPYVRVAHAIVAHAAAPPAPAPSVKGHRVFVTAWGAGHEAVTATGLGATLFDSVVAAATEVAKTAPAEARVELNVVTSAGRSAVGAEMRENVHEIGLHGYIGGAGEGAVGWVLASDILDQHRVTPTVINVAKTSKPTALRILDGEAMAATMAKRAGVPADQVATMEVYRFETIDLLEARNPSDAPITLYRTMPLPVKDVTAESLLHSVHAAAEYLANGSNESGEFMYAYDPVTDAPIKGYGIVRHTGTTYGLLSAYGEEHVPAWLAAAKRAIGYLKAHLVTAPGGLSDGQYLVDGKDEEQQKVGGAGLAIAALAQLETVTGETSELETMRALGRFIVKQQRPDGHFRDNADVMKEDPSKKGLKAETFYYPGEAILGLVRLAALDSDPEWLAAARKGADYLIKTRDAGKAPADLFPDPWLTNAYRELYAATKDETYANQARKIAEGVATGGGRNEISRYKDYRGSYLDDAETLAAATRLEVLTATIRLQRYADADAKNLFLTARELSSFTASQQLDGDRAYFVKNQAKALGGVRASLRDNDVRIDYVEHALLGWLDLGRLLRDPAEGKAK